MELTPRQLGSEAQKLYGEHKSIIHNIRMLNIQLPRQERESAQFTEEADAVKSGNIPQDLRYRYAADEWVLATDKTVKYRIQRDLEDSKNLYNSMQRRVPSLQTRLNENLEAAEAHYGQNAEAYFSLAVLEAALDGTVVELES